MKTKMAAFALLAVILAAGVAFAFSAAGTWDPSSTGGLSGSGSQSTVIAIPTHGCGSPLTDPTNEYCHASKFCEGSADYEGCMEHWFLCGSYSVSREFTPCPW